MQKRPQRPAVTQQAGSKPTLQMVQLAIYRVRQRHLEAYFVKVFHLERFDFLWATGATPGLCPEYQVEPTLPDTWNANEEANHIRRGQRTNKVALMLNILCLDGYIPAGKYIIDTHPEPPPAEVYRNMLGKTEDPNHPACVAFRREHHHNRAFTQLAATMDKMVQKEKP